MTESSTNVGPAQSTGDELTTGGPAECSQALFDEFDDAAVGEIWSVIDPDAVSETDSDVQFSLVAQEIVYVGLRLAEPLDFSRAWAIAELGSLPEQEGAQVSFDVRDAGDTFVAFVLQSDELAVRTKRAGMPFETLFSVPLDLKNHRWLRVRHSEVTRFDVSADAETWENVAETDFEWDPTSAHIRLTATAWMPIPEPETVSIRSFEFCAEPR